MTAYQLPRRHPGKKSSSCAKLFSILDLPLLLGFFPFMCLASLVFSAKEFYRHLLKSCLLEEGSKHCFNTSIQLQQDNQDINSIKTPNTVQPIYLSVKALMGLESTCLEAAGLKALCAQETCSEHSAETASPETWEGPGRRCLQTTCVSE